MAAIFALPLTRCRRAFTLVLRTELLDAENVGVAFGVSLLSCIEAEKHFPLAAILNLLLSSTSISTVGNGSYTHVFTVSCVTSVFDWTICIWHAGLLHAVLWWLPEFTKYCRKSIRTLFFYNLFCGVGISMRFSPKHVSIIWLEISSISQIHKKKLCINNLEGIRKPPFVQQRVVDRCIDYSYV